MMQRMACRLYILAVVLAAFNVVAAEDWTRQTVIVCNERDPESQPLAEYYARRRGIPTNQICVIRARPAETITRREFNDEVREPILRFLTRNGLLTQDARVVDGKPFMETLSSRVSCLALIYGVPLRVESDPTIREKAKASATGKKPELLRDEASVDSELALLPSHGHPIAGPLGSPFFGSYANFAPPMNRRMLLVGRLDGPDAPTVRRMIDDALAVERYGLHGRAYFDARGIKDKGYIAGDNWIKGACQALREAGYECELDEHEAVFDEDYPMTDAAIYAGWYAGNMTGPFTRYDFQFRPGAIAYHIHSSSAATVRTRVANWVGPLLGKGAAASMGSVFEPYLAMTPHIDLFFRRLLDGRPFIEAGYNSDVALSWQTVFVGDPLYRPFEKSLDEQILLLKLDNRPELEWAWLRKVNLSARDEALKLCRAKAEELRSAVLYEKLGDLESSPRAYQEAMKHTADNWTQVRVAVKLARAYERTNQTALALAVYEDLCATQSLRKNAPGFFQKARDLAEATGDTAKAQAWQAKIDEQTKKR